MLSHSEMTTVGGSAPAESSEAALSEQCRLFREFSVGGGGSTAAAASPLYRELGVGAAGAGSNGSDVQHSQTLSLPTALTLTVR